MIHSILMMWVCLVIWIVCLFGRLKYIFVVGLDIWVVIKNTSVWVGGIGRGDWWWLDGRHGICLRGGGVLGYFFLGSMVVYLCKSHTNFVSKFCGGGWSVVKDGYSKYIVWLSQSHRSLSMIIMVIYMLQCGWRLGRVIVVFASLVLWFICLYMSCNLEWWG